MTETIISFILECRMEEGNAANGARNVTRAFSGSALRENGLLRLKAGKGGKGL